MMSKVSRFLGRWGATGGLLLAGLFLAGCLFGRGSAEDPRFAPVPGLPGDNGVATSPVTSNPAASTNDLKRMDPELKAGDPIVITFSDTPVPVMPWADAIKVDGTITLPQNLTFVADGKTRRQLEEEIRAGYVPRYYQTMTVSVSRKDATRFYYVLGDVKAPGRQLYIGRITVLKAISSCGDFTDFANKRRVKLTRTDGRIFIVNCKKALKHPELDLEVFPDDQVFVPRRWL